MKAKNKKYFLAAISLIVSVGLSVGVKALAESAPPSSGATVTVATVNIYNAKIDAQNGNKLDISFDLSNGAGMQYGIKYAVEIYQKTIGSDKRLIDQKVFDETINLSEKQSIHKSISYDAPAWASGDVEVWIDGKNESGLPLGLVQAGTAHLAGDNKAIYVFGCYLTLNGDDSTKYIPSQGVDFSPNENASATCLLKNNLGDQVTVMPEFDNYLRSTFGTFLSSKKSDAITLAADEQKIVSFSLPKTDKPQAYDSVLTFLDARNNKISNPTVLHYVIQGESGTIQNLLLDKSDYMAGEDAKVTFDWTGSADSFDGARNQGRTPYGAIAEFTISDSLGQICADNFKKELTAQDQHTEIAIPITSDCAGAQVGVVLRDANGNELDQANFGNESAFGKNNVQPNVSKEAQEGKIKRKLVYDAVLLITFILVLIILIVHSIKKRKNKNNVGVLIFLLILTGGFWINNQGAKADTWSVYAGNGDYYYWNASLNKLVFNPGEKITVYSTGATSPCNNYHPMTITGTINGHTETIFSGTTNSPYHQESGYQHYCSPVTDLGNNKYYIEIPGGWGMYLTPSMCSFWACQNETLTRDPSGKPTSWCADWPVINWVSGTAMNDHFTAEKTPGIYPAKFHYVSHMSGGWDLVSDGVINYTVNGCIPDSTCLSHPITWGTCSGPCGPNNGTQTGTCDNGCGGTGNAASRQCTASLCCAPTTCPSAAEICAGASCDPGCGGTVINGTKNCTNWKEVAP